VAAVFVPIAFISGLTGMFYKQFAITIVIATFISTFNSLTLSPAMAALLLKPKDAEKDFITKFIDKIFGKFFDWFNNMFRNRREGYAKFVGKTISRRFLMMVIFTFLLVSTVLSFRLVPPGFVPSQDKGYLISFAQLPAGATLDRSEEVIRKMSELALKEEGVTGAVAFPGLSINGFSNSSSAGIVFVRLDEFSNRTADNLSGFAISQSLQKKFNNIDEAFIRIFPPPPVRGLGSTGGFKLQVQDKGDLGDAELNSVVQDILGKANSTPELFGVWSSYNVNVPQLYAELDRTKAEQLGVPVEDVFKTLQIYLGSLYINDFNQFGRTYQVIAQADSKYRATPNDIGSLKTKNQDGEMVPLSSVINVSESFGPEMAMKYNAYRSADISGNPGQGFSSGQAQEKITQILNDSLPQGFNFEWTELTYQQILAGDTAIYIFPLCLLLVFLVLAAQYESLTLPIAVVLIVPMAVLSAILGVFFFGGDNNIFTQISLFVLAGLASKNAILIVEFARELEREGKETVEAAMESSRLRLRPILMTSFAFILGVLPLVLSQGAGSEMRQAIGVAVFSGMVGVTFFGLVLTPTFYVIMRKLEMKFDKSPEIKK